MTDDAIKTLGDSMTADLITILRGIKPIDLKQIIAFKKTYPDGELFVILDKYLKNKPHYHCLKNGTWNDILNAADWEKIAHEVQYGNVD